jgi:peptide/nickel transport system ATP-binding protein/oligopeptide transport system ATP-binding protein
MSLLEVQGLVKHFPVKGGAFGGVSAHVRAVDGLDFQVNEGETLALVGESGCGKSTVGRLVLRLIEPSAGRVRFEGDDLLALDAEQMRVRRRRLQVIFQDPYASLNPRMTVGAMLGEPLFLHGLAKDQAARRKRVGELLELVGLRPEHARRYPHEFSGGQRQRLAIARALAVEPKLIVADEPVSALDVSIQAQVINLMRSLQQRFGLAYIFISHDLAVVKHIADRIAVMYLGKIVETATTDELFRNPRHPYTRALLSAVPLPDPTAVRERALLEGDIPSAIAPPPGCRFHTRCRFAKESCRRDIPALVDDGPLGVKSGHATACPWWPEFPPVSITVGAAARADDKARLDRLQAAFVKQEAT